MPHDETSERIRRNLGLDNFEQNTRPKIIQELQSILASLDDSKFYPKAREDLGDYIAGWNPTGSQKTVGHNFYLIGDRLRENGVIPQQLEAERIQDAQKEQELKEKHGEKELEEKFPFMRVVRGVVAKIRKKD